MAWAYADYESQASDADRLSRLRLHIDEVSAKISAAVSDGPASRSTDGLVNYLTTVLTPRRQELERRTASAAGRHSLVRRGATR